MNFSVRRSPLSASARCLLALTATLLGTGCSKSVTYTYVDVHVLIDPQSIPPSQLATVVGCEFQVLGAEMTDGYTLRCRENNVPYDVGTFSWTSNAPTGSLQFLVRIFAVNRVVVGEITSEAIPVSPGKHVKIDVLVRAVPATTEPDGGDDASSPTDGGIDAGLDGAASDSAGAEAGPDLAADQSTAADAGPDQTPDAGPIDGTGPDAAPDGPVFDTVNEGPIDQAVDVQPIDVSGDGPADGVSGDAEAG